MDSREAGSRSGARGCHLCWTCPDCLAHDFRHLPGREMAALNPSLQEPAEGPLTTMFKLALHSVSYAGLWPGQVRLTLQQFIPKAARLGFDAVMLMAKRPHLSLLDMTSAARREVKKLTMDHGVRVAVLAAYNDFNLGAEVP